ncbi:MAG: WbqC family protein [Balneolales bacterium]
MKLALLYPAYLPGLYFLACVMQADRTVLLDTGPYSRKSRVHRGKIRTPEGFQWLNIPIITEDRKKPLTEVRIDHSTDWVTRHIRALEYNYRNSIYFDYYEPEIRADLEQAREHEMLVGFLRFFMGRLFVYLQLDLEIEWASQIPSYSSGPDEFARRLHATQVFQDQNSQNYQRQSSFRIEPDFKHPRYHQHFEGFIPDLSLLDLLFQLGPSAYEVTDQLGTN